MSEYYLVAGGIGAVAGLVGAAVGLLFRSASENAPRNLGLSMALVVGMLSNAFVMPEYKVRREVSKARDEFDRAPLYRALAVEHPELREAFSAEVERMVRSGASSKQAQVQAFRWGEQQLGTLMESYLPRTTDAALLGYASSLVSTLQGLRKQSPDLCFLFLFGEPQQRADAFVGITDRAILDPMLKATTVVVEQAAKERPQGVSKARSDQLIAEVIEQLIAANGAPMQAAIASLANPNEPGVDKARTCDASIKLYQAVLELPAPKNAWLIRSLLAPAPEGTAPEEGAEADGPRAGILPAKDGACPGEYLPQGEVCVHETLAESPTIADQIAAYKQGAAPPLVE